MKKPCIDQWERMLIIEYPDSREAQLLEFKLSFHHLKKEVSRILLPIFERFFS